MEVSRRNCPSRNEPEAILGHYYVRGYYRNLFDSHLPDYIEPHCTLWGDRYAKGLSYKILAHDNSIARSSGWHFFDLWRSRLESARHAIADLSEAPDGAS